jgi:cellobiose-specific phosphotransferase system component IIA
MLTQKKINEAIKHARQRSYEKKIDDAIEEAVERTRSKLAGDNALGFIYNDGGRADAGYKGSTGDCVVRAIAIAEQRDYEEVRRELMEYNRNYANTSRSRIAKKIQKRGATTRRGNWKRVYEKLLDNNGWTKHAKIRVGSTDRCYMLKSDIPSGRVLLKVRRHLVACVDHVINDTWDSRESDLWVDGLPTAFKTPKCVTTIWTR